MRAGCARSNASNGKNGCINPLGSKHAPARYRRRYGLILHPSSFFFMPILTILGLVAGLFTTFSFALQVWKCWRTKSVGDISTEMYVAFAFGVILWLVYGVALNNLPLIVWNGITLFLVMMILWMKYRYSR
jgi:MtN3 and saliva related transmembrane protein